MDVTVAVEVAVEVVDVAEVGAEVVDARPPRQRRIVHQERLTQEIRPPLRPMVPNLASLSQPCKKNGLRRNDESGRPHLVSRTGHNPAFRETMSAFTDALLAADPAIPGLDLTVVIPARRMRLTLGTISLGRDDPARTVDAAAKLLDELRPRVQELLQGEKLSVSLDSMDVMKHGRRNDERAHVMWVGAAADGAGVDKVKAVADLIQTAFQDAGMLVDQKHVLKLRCPVLNTMYRKLRARQRVPFSYPSVLVASDSESAECAVLENGKTKRQRGPVKIDFGTWGWTRSRFARWGAGDPRANTESPPMSQFLEDK
ncbi:hypothetical protein C8Q80DRAFT_1124270 [Daedaleopsis nitida]|nr:hypothetical protein C8Q80DRAFT_1124270 [Daedaleopsis nitida]